MRDEILAINGVRVPRFLYGTAWKEDQTERLAELAMQQGFRGIDTANQRRHYHEAAVGQAISATVANDLLRQYLRRTVYDDGLYEDIDQGISLGCPLSPLMGALFLDRLDRRMEAKGLCYIRFMDDWVILAPSRWKLRRAVRIVQQTLDELKFQPHPDKTFIGRTERGFCFLGYQIKSARLVGVAPPTVERFVERVNRLYEQGASLRCIGDYIRRWMVWVVSGLGDWVKTLRWPVYVFDANHNPTIPPLPLVPT